MAPLIVLVLVTLLARGVGQLGVAPLRDWAASTRVGLAVMLCFTAVAHFNSMRPDLIAMVPPSVPNPEFMVTFTGICEILGAVGLLVPRTRRIAAAALIVFLLAVLPANIHAAQAGVTLRGAPATPIIPRVALQVLFIGLLWWSGIRAPGSRDDAAGSSAARDRAAVHSGYITRVETRAGMVLPMEQLPYIDEHALRIDAPVDVVWTALLKVLQREMGGSALIARILGCDPAQGTAEFAGRPGEAVPGFRVAEAEPGRRLVLRGRHRFSDYALTFVFDGDRLRARTHATFPGVRGRLYRAAVIGSGGHRLVTRRLLRQVARAGRSPAPA